MCLWKVIEVIEVIEAIELRPLVRSVCIAAVVRKLGPDSVYIYLQRHAPLARKCLTWVSVVRVLLRSSSSQCVQSRGCHASVLVSGLGIFERMRVCVSFPSSPRLNSIVLGSVRGRLFLLSLFVVTTRSVTRF